ncbi:MAG: Protein of unknown function (DUF1553)/Protein of unknown function (DUF1549)/Planctomycete [Planctomycetaceae bacterium]|nr:Protein of unknown function (DUF1553)/Protein of unknown function (DUF1549)/Planctomycete [Planctomycetaceae bacterium]
MRVVCRLLVLLPLAVIVGWMFGDVDCPADEIPSADAKFFREEVLPLLKESCQRCHGEKKQNSGLRLDSREAVLKGGQNGPAIVVGKPDQSLLMKVINHDGDIQMPPDEKLDDEEIAIFKKWIEKDAPWPVDKKKA